MLNAPFMASFRTTMKLMESSTGPHEVLETSGHTIELVGHRRSEIEIAARHAGIPADADPLCEGVVAGRR
ncbi:hypothetical protein C1H69_03405 [Billgrantia endophytica]|uniref:Uncharacterized protein n=2 Tax=Billgrantia endophytica TaxID=2033802 RepID=A0A2N7U9W3_9GAMM|nr:hypothetical protein C1H69_03405 [Halomonas endophytica]